MTRKSVSGILAIVLVVLCALPFQGCSDEKKCWREMTPETSNKLWDVWGASSDDVFAVGRSTILHYDGNHWVDMEVNENFRSVWGSSGADVFAVGSWEKKYIHHFDGNEWSAVDTGTTGLLRGVWGSSGNDVWAVGYDQESLAGPADSIFMHYDGIKWTAFENNFSTLLQAVWGSSSSDNVAFTVFVKSSSMPSIAAASR